MRSRIRGAAVALFREKGYAATTVEEIAARADVAKGTFFNYFPRKEAVLCVIAELMVDELHERLGEPHAWGTTLQDRARALFLGMAAIAARDRELSMAVLFEDMRQLHMHAEHDPALRELQVILRDLIRHAHDTGEIRPDVEPERVATLLESTFFLSLVDWLSRGLPEEELRADISQKLDIVFHGLAAGPRAAAEDTA